MSGSRILIVNADDFGRSPGINAGIIRAHLDGIVTSTTLMVNLPWTEAAAHAARNAPALAIGLHLNLCYGGSVSRPDDVLSLVDEVGRLKTDTRSISDEASLEDVRVEMLAQLERFRRIVGREPTHVDSHKYVHSAPRIAPVVGALAAELGLPVRATGEEDRRLLRGSGAKTPDAFEGRFHGLDGEGVSLGILIEALESVTPGVTELMCHPGFVDDHIQDSSYTVDRERELDALCAPEARSAVAARYIRLATFSTLKEG